MTTSSPTRAPSPVPKGWNTKRRHAQPGRADTVVTDYHGRAVCFATGEPSGLSATLPGALAQLRQVAGREAKILLGFDRGGSYPVAFRAIRDAARGLGDLAARPARPGHRSPAPVLGRPRRRQARRDRCTWPMRPSTIKDYGQCRQITLFEDGGPVLQVLTSDTTAPAAALLAWLRCRWRDENLFKYLEANYGIHWLCDYHAELEDDDHPIANPERKAARARLRHAEAALAAAERELAGVLSSPQLPAAAKNKAIPPAEKKIATASGAVAAAKAALNAFPPSSPRTR